jgi:DNA polymerase-4
MPIARAVRLCPQAMYVPVPRKACSEKHREVRALLEAWAPRVEPASIDEFYLDLTGTEGVYRGEALVATARRIREAVQVGTGLTLSIGGGTNRLVAKLAAQRAKPRPGAQAPGVGNRGPGFNEGGAGIGGRAGGVYVVEPGQEAAFLAEHLLAEIPGVGPRLQATLGGFGLVRVTDALRVDEATLARWLGERTGRWLFERIRGRGSDDVDVSGESLTMSHEETFPTDLTSDDALETRLLGLVTHLAHDLRAGGLAAARLTVKIRDHDFRTRQAGRTLPEPVHTDRALFKVARELLGVLRARRRTPARLLGVAAGRLVAGPAPAQLPLLAPAAPLETDRDRALAAAVDRITRRLGEDAVVPARLLRQGQ